MSNKQMLQELIELAVKHGFDLNNFKYNKEDELHKYRFINDYLSLLCIRKNYEAFDADYHYEIRIDIVKLLFSHQFAKAIFGDDEHYCHLSNGKKQPLFFCKIQQLAITPEQERIKYAYKNRRKD